MRWRVSLVVSVCLSLSGLLWRENCSHTARLRLQLRIPVGSMSINEHNRLPMVWYERGVELCGMAC